MSRPQTLACFALVAVGSVLATGCFHAEARTPAASPGLAIPVPPSRTLVPSTVSLDPIPAAPTAPVTPNPAAPKPAEPPPPARTSGPPSTSTSTPPPPVVEAPAPVLRTTPDVSGLDPKVKATLGEAETLLQKLDVSTLGRDTRDHYNTAVGYIRTAREALGYGNFVHAQALADKALVLAKQLTKGK